MASNPSRRQNNLAFLRRVDPVSAARLAAHAEKPFEGELVPAKKEGWTVRIGRAWVHSKYHPGREAEQLVAAETEALTELNLHFGLGLGYLVAADATLPAGVRFVFEPNPALLWLALDVLDLPLLYEERGLRLFLDESAFGAALEEVFDRGFNFRVFALPFYLKHAPEAYGRFRDLVRAKLEASKVRQVTLAKIYPHVMRSSLRSLWQTTVLPSVDGLVGQLRGKPAVILAAGPSLERNISELKPYRDQILLFAVARVMRALEKQGLVPDFLVHTEAKDYRAQVYGISGLDRVCLLLSDQCHPDFFSLPAGQTLVYQSDTNLVTAWKTRFLPQLKQFRIDSGGSVATEAFSLAFAFGCDPIVLAGQDLAVAGARTYIDGERNRAFPYDPEHVRPVPGFFGQAATSLIHYVTFIHWYEEAAAVLRAQGNPTRLFNATEGGAALSGFTPTRLVALLHSLDGAGPTGVGEAVRRAAARVGVLPRAALGKLIRQTRDQIDEALQFTAEFATFAARTDTDLAKLEAQPLRDMTFFSTLQERFEWYCQAIFTLLDETPLVGGFCHQSLQDLRALRRRSRQIDRHLGADALLDLTRRELAQLQDAVTRIQEAQTLINQSLNAFQNRLELQES
ncbi:motility associated factor glycosyltransferase family protein [Acanthopleuribacter pedis]|uniref:Motility associated factor glycosyltransferase family protein n=1 Tax=Acanthopleuribacter pedis TaxID=442870 RepID=A0A8J7U296_9BACT|nr:6-hydroxymethylpterin diphosphokinase MptE-like protein [Acanthopleuribacter pedis]MBO1317038.1 motility associated factor glycosyltransferase family protein [Acanthopleuribacter pedis]